MASVCQLRACLPACLQPCLLNQLSQRLEGHSVTLHPGSNSSRPALTQAYSLPCLLPPPPADLDTDGDGIISSGDMVAMLRNKLPKAEVSRLALGGAKLRRVCCSVRRSSSAS
jgi:hypothetical protein